MQQATSDTTNDRSNARERLLVSHHTVSGRLRSVFTTLAINSRVELIRSVGVHAEQS